jgi:type IV secretory pathway VirB4 component
MVTEYPPLADVLPYRGFLGPGRVDLRDEGILQGFWLRGPSPAISDDADLLKRSEQLGRAPVHFRNGDSIQIAYDKRPAPKPPELQYSHPAAALVMAEMGDRFTAEEHWIIPTWLCLTHQYEKLLKSAVRAFMLGGRGPQRLNRHTCSSKTPSAAFRRSRTPSRKPSP